MRFTVITFALGVACGGAYVATPTSAAPSAPDVVPHMSNGFWRPDEVMIDGHALPIAGGLLATVQRQAAAQLGCAQVTARWVSLGSPHTPSEVLFAEGCEERLIYNFATPEVDGRDLELYTMARVTLHARTADR